MQRALQAAQQSFAFSPRYGAQPVLGASAVQGPSYQLPLCFICPLVMVRCPSWPAYHLHGARGPAYHLPFCPNCPVMVRGPSSKRALRRRPSYHLPFVSFAPFSTRGLSRPAYRLPFCSICPCYGAGPSSEQALRRRRSYHLPFVSFAHLYGARPEWASLSCSFLLYLPLLWHGASPERASVGDPVVICLLFPLPTVMAHGPGGPAYHLPCCSICSAARVGSS